MAPTPTMIEAWMREHLGRHGGIDCWRVLLLGGNPSSSCSCSALAVSMDSPYAASTVLRHVTGMTMLMTPLVATAISEFPDNDRLAGEIQKVALRTFGSGPAYAEVMASCWQALSELPAPIAQAPLPQQGGGGRAAGGYVALPNRL